MKNIIFDLLLEIATGLIQEQPAVQNLMDLLGINLDGIDPTTGEYCSLWTKTYLPYYLNKCRHRTPTNKSAPKPTQEHQKQGSKTKHSRSPHNNT